MTTFVGIPDGIGDPDALVVLEGRVTQVEAIEVNRVRVERDFERNAGGRANPSGLDRDAPTLVALFHPRIHGAGCAIDGTRG